MRPVTEGRSLADATRGDASSEQRLVDAHNDLSLELTLYRKEVNRLADRLPGARVGTVDKFQGQEAAVVIYSMTTSTADDAPRGMEFLYNPNRFNVATSRARCACIVFGSPALLSPECRTPRQMELANVVCRFVEMSRGVTVGARVAAAGDGFAED